jgi:inhibitor of cysteine peptidase
MATRKFAKKDDGTNIHLKEGDRLEIELPENATTGYKWLLPGMTDIRVKETFRPTKAGIPGSGGTACFELVPLHKISARKIILKYQRPWENDLPPEDIFSFTLTVQ